MNDQTHDPIPTPAEVRNRRFNLFSRLLGIASKRKLVVPLDEFRRVKAKHYKRWTSIPGVLGVAIAPGEDGHILVLVRDKETAAKIESEVDGVKVQAEVWAWN